MGKQKEATKVVRLTAPNGVVVGVSEEKAERLIPSGYEAVKAASAGTTAKAPARKAAAKAPAKAAAKPVEPAAGGDSGDSAGS